MDGWPTIKATEMMAPVLHRMQALLPLDPVQAKAVLALAGPGVSFAPGATLIPKGTSVAQPRYLLSGWACRQRVLSDGRRQIFSLLLPGDGIDVCMQPNRLTLTATIALTRVVTVDASALLNGNDDGADLSAVHEAAANLDESLLLDHVVRLGRQTAYERLAHLMLELRFRLGLAGLCDGRRFPMPLTQEMLADVLGLSMVHVNRTVQQLRRDRLVEIVGGQVTLQDPEGLARIADFVPPRFSDLQQGQ